MTRFVVAEFTLANPLYVGATVNFYTVDADGVKTTTLATLYDAPVGTGTLANPQTLNSEGRVEQPVYIDGPVIADISELSIADHSTGVIWGGVRWRGAWATDTVFIPNDIVIADDGSNDWYIATAYHESDVFATDVSSGYLEKALDVSVLATLFSIPDLGGHALGMLRVNAGATASEWRTPAEVRGDLDLEPGTDVLAPNGSGSSLSGVLLTGKQVIGCWGAEAIKPETTAGCNALLWAESTTNKVMTPYLGFDAATQKYGQLKFRAPKGLDESAGFTAVIIWKEASGASAHNCVWQIEMQAQGDGDTIDSAWGTAVTVTDTGEAGKRQETPAFATITPGGTWAAGDHILLRVSRKAADAADTLDVNADLIELVLFATYAAGVEP